MKDSLFDFPQPKIDKKRWNEMTEKEREPLWNLRGK